VFPFSTSGRRGRKPSISGSTPISPSGSSGWCLPRRQSTDSSYALEEGIDLTPTKPPRSAVGRLRLWSLRLASVLKRNISLPFGHHSESHSRPGPLRAMRHVSMPLSTTFSPYRNEGYLSQPPSPRSHGSGFFVPATLANGSLTVPTTRPSSTSPEPRSSPAPSSVSPPRLKSSWQPKSRQNSTTAHSLNHLLSPDNQGGGAGWNDPPTSMLGYTLENDRERSPSAVSGSSIALGVASGVLTPTAGTNGYESTLSRNSSRVNLHEMGLAQRSASRAGTPHDFNDHTS